MKPRIHRVLAQWIPGFTPFGSPARVVPESLKRFLRQRDNLPGPESATVGAAARSALQQSGDTA